MRHDWRSDRRRGSGPDECGISVSLRAVFAPVPSSVPGALVAPDRRCLCRSRPTVSLCLGSLASARLSAGLCLSRALCLRLGDRTLALVSGGGGDVDGGGLVQPGTAPRFMEERQQVGV